MTNNEMVGLFFVVIIPVIGGLIALVKAFITPVLKLEKAIEKLLLTLEHMKENDALRDKRLNKHGEEIDNLKTQFQDHENRIEILEKRCEKNGA